MMRATSSTGGSFDWMMHVMSFTRGLFDRSMHCHVIPGLAEQGASFIG
jgi:hypothetical protein